jgi:5'(3')-deoxyribonucleotidase
MKFERQKILIDIDDTFLKSSEEIIRQLNKKNSTSKTIEDLTDYGYRSIDPGVTQEDIRQMYSSDDFFKNVTFNDGAIEFLIKYSKIFDIVFVSYGTEENLMQKVKMLNNISQQCELNNIFFVGCETGKSNKRDVLLDNVYIAIDDNADHLSEMNSPKKILLKNGRDLAWNQTPINDECTYCANSFSDIIDMIEFDLKLKDMGVWLNA